MIYFVRHGQTDWNKRKVMMGHTDIPLNEDGIKHAYYLKEKLKDMHFDIVYCSPLIRARQTCEIIFEDRKQKIIYCDALKERDYGSYEGQEKSSFDYNAFWNYANQEGVENFFSFAWPITKFIANELYPNLNKNILIVSHGGVSKWFEILLSQQSLAPEEVGPYLPKNSELITYDLKNNSKAPYCINSQRKSEFNIKNVSIITPNILNAVKTNSRQPTLQVAADKPKFYYRTNFIILNKNNDLILQHFSKTNEYKLPGRGLKNNAEAYEATKHLNVRLGLKVDEKDVKEFEDIYEIRFNDSVGEIVFTKTFFIKVDNFDCLKPNFSKKEQEENGEIKIVPFYEAVKLTEKSLKTIKTLDESSTNYRPLKTKESIVFRDQVLLRHFIDYALSCL